MKRITILKKLYPFLKGNLFNIFWIFLAIIYFNIDISESRDGVYFLDVGQGDAILIQDGNTQVLVDVGPDISVVYALSKYLPLDDREIEVLVITHPHEDHIGGLKYIFEQFKIKEIWIYPVCYENSSYEGLLESKYNIKYVYSGQSYILGDINIDVLWPNIGKKEQCTMGIYQSWDGNVNNDSIVMQISFNNKEYLLMGDAEKEVEKEIGNSLNKVDVLKAGHHCSKTSNSETFLKIVRPEYAICSCGEGNKFGHPSSGTLENFSKLGVQYFVTYESGDVVFE